MDLMQKKKDSATGKTTQRTGISSMDQRENLALKSNMGAN
jgi:hypothetical protein